MIETIFTLFADYGPRALAWALLALAGLLARYVWVKVKSETIRGVLERALLEVNAAVLDVAQTYADAIKERRAGGLTDAERREAKRLAMAKVKALLGADGLKRLARIVGLDVDSWLGNKVEAAVRASKPSIAIAGASSEATTTLVPLRPA